MEIEEERKLASKLFNDCWNLIEKSTRTSLEDGEMLHLANTSRWHWGNVGGDPEKSMGEWQCSRVNSLLGNGPAALLHAELSRYWCANLPASNFTHASATEALAYANYVMGRTEEALRLKNEAMSLLKGVEFDDAEHIRTQIEELPF